MIRVSRDKWNDDSQKQSLYKYYLKTAISFIFLYFVYLKTMSLSKINYKTLFGGLQATAIGRNKIFVASEQSAYSTRDPKTITVQLPNQSYCDAGSAYLSYRMRLAYKRPVLTKAVTVTLDGVGALAPFTSALVKNAVDSVLTEENQAHRSALLKMLNHGAEYTVSVGKNSLAFNPAFVQNLEYNSPVATALGSGNALQVVLPINATAGTTTEYSDYIEVAIPLAYISSIFSNGSEYIPLKHMSEKSSALKIELNMAQVHQALLAYTDTSCLNGYSPGSVAIPNADYAVLRNIFDANQSDMAIELLDVRVHYDSVILSADYDMAIKKQIDTMGVTLDYENHSQQLNSGFNGSANEHTVNLNKFALSVKSVTVAVRELDCNTVAWKSNSWCGRYDMLEIGSFVGSQPWPTTPLKLTAKNYNGQAYLLNAMNTHKNGSLNGFVKAYNPNINSRFGFWYLTFDYSPKEVDTEPSDHMGGKDTKSSSSQISVNFKRATDSDPVLNGSETYVKQLQITSDIVANQVVFVKQSIAEASES